MGSSKQPKTPPAPDPYQTAAAQTGSNVSTAIANSWLQNANEIGPTGSVTYKKTGSREVVDPTTGKAYKVPTFTRTTTLSPEQQNLYNQQTAIGSELNNLALNQSRRLGEHLSKPFNLDGLPQAPGDFEPYRANVESKMLERINPQLERDYSSLENRLINQGLVRGSDAFKEAMAEHGRNVNDARTQAYLASGNEARAAGSYQGTVRQNAIQERKLMRDQPINEITALMQGGEVSMPQFTPYQSGQVAGTPIGDMIYKTADLQRQDAATAARANGQMWDAIGNVGMGLFRWSDARTKHDVRFVHQDENGVNWYVFRYNGFEHLGPQFGVMAQELLDVRPDAVHIDPMTGLYFVNYGVL